MLRLPSHVFLGFLPLSRLVEMQASVRDIARCARGLVFWGGELAIAVLEFAQERGVGVVDDVERACRHAEFDEVE